MHDATPPKPAAGGEFYDSVLTIADGRVTKAPLVETKGVPVGPCRVHPAPLRRVS